MVRADGVCMVIDFGIARAVGAAARTRPGVLKGKQAYMSPEVLEGTPLDGRTDLWSLGVVLFEALSGRRLFLRDGRRATTQAILHDPIPRLAEIAPGLPAGLDAIVDRALARDPDRRWSSARELGAALAAHAPQDAGATAREVSARFADELAVHDRALAAALAEPLPPDDAPRDPPTEVIE
jgi:serine/threonine-protein kinase